MIRTAPSGFIICDPIICLRTRAARINEPARRSSLAQGAPREIFSRWLAYSQRNAAICSRAFVLLPQNRLGTVELAHQLARNLIVVTRCQLQMAPNSQPLEHPMSLRRGRPGGGGPSAAPETASPNDEEALSRRECKKCEARYDLPGRGRINSYGNTMIFQGIKCARLRVLTATASGLRRCRASGATSSSSSCRAGYKLQLIFMPF